MSHIFMCMGRWDIVTSMQTWFVIPPIPCIFMQTMSTKNYYNFGTINNDNSRHVTIDARGANVADIIRAALAEDVEPVQEEKPAKQSSLPFLNLEKFKELNLYSLEEFEDKYRKAVKGGAPQLAKFLKQYKELDVLNLKDYNKRETYDELKEFFGEDLDFGYPNFAAYY